MARSYDFARSIGFPQINIDLDRRHDGRDGRQLAGLHRQDIEMQPDSVTIYQMEVPYNTGIFKEMKILGQTTAPVADWKTKRRWVSEAFAALENAGYSVASAYTAVKNSSKAKFLYRDLLWAGADLVGLGVASFSHVGGTQFPESA